MGGVDDEGLRDGGWLSLSPEQATQTLFRPQLRAKVSFSSTDETRSRAYWRCRDRYSLPALTVRRSCFCLTACKPFLDHFRRLGGLEINRVAANHYQHHIAQTPTQPRRRASVLRDPVAFENLSARSAAPGHNGLKRHCAQKVWPLRVTSNANRSRQCRPASTAR